MRPYSAPISLTRLDVDDARCRVGQQHQDMAVRLGEMKLDGVLPDGLDRAERSVKAAIDRARLLVQHAVEARRDGLGIQRVAVAERPAGLDLDGEDLAVRREGIVGRQALLDVVLRVEAKETFQHGQIDRVPTGRSLKAGSKVAGSAPTATRRTPAGWAEACTAARRQAGEQVPPRGRIDEGCACSAVPQAGNFGRSRRVCANGARSTACTMRSQSLVSWSLSLLILVGAEGSDESQQITAFDLSQIHKFTIYMN